MVDEDDAAPVPDVPLDAELPVPELGIEDDDELDGLLMLPDELLGADDELDEDDGVLLDVSVVDEEELDVAGGVAGGVTVVLLLLLAGGVAGTTVVVFSSLRSHADTLSPIATASALANKVLDFMGTPFKFMGGNENRRQNRHPFRPVVLASSVPCHARTQRNARGRLP